MSHADVFTLNTIKQDARKIEDALNDLIMITPTGKVRNEITAANIHLSELKSHVENALNILLGPS